jgi:broad specificity phosphatase PhoE
MSEANLSEPGVTAGEGSQATRVHLVRHGQVSNPSGLFYGRLPGFGLSEKGRAEAGRAARALAGRSIAAVYSSPQQRALETAAIVASAHCGLAVTPSELLNEVHTPYDGWDTARVAERGWDIYAGNEPPYERPADILGRLSCFLNRAREAHHGQEVVAVTHGDPIAFVVLWSQGQPVTAAGRGELYREILGTGCVVTLSFVGDAADERPGLQYPLLSG